MGACQDHIVAQSIGRITTYFNSCHILIMGVIIGDLNIWVETWAHGDIPGGLRGREADDILHRFKDNLEDVAEDNKIAGLQVDQSKCFDRVSPAMCIACLVYFGLNNGSAESLTEFYSRVMAWFSSRGAVSGQPIGRWHGFFQGCPFSMLMLEGAMEVRRFPSTIAGRVCR